MYSFGKGAGSYSQTINRISCCPPEGGKQFLSDFSKVQLPMSPGPFPRGARIPCGIFLPHLGFTRKLEAQQASQIWNLIPWYEEFSTFPEGLVCYQAPTHRPSLFILFDQFLSCPVNFFPGRPVNRASAGLPRFGEVPLVPGPLPRWPSKLLLFPLVSGESPHFLVSCILDNSHPLE